MKKIIALFAILVVCLLVVTGCGTTTEDNDTLQPPNLPAEDLDDTQDNLDDENLQPPQFPEG